MSHINIYICERKCIHRYIPLFPFWSLVNIINFMQESTVLGSLPLKRFSTSPTSKSDDVHKTTTFKVFNARRTYYMQADNADAMARYKFDILLVFK